MKPTDPRHRPKRWLRNVKDGTLYEWNEILADHPLCREIHDEDVFPEAYARNPEPVAEKQRGRPKKNLGVAEMEATVAAEETPMNFETEDFGAEIGKGWPK